MTWVTFIKVVSIFRGMDFSGYSANKMPLQIEKGLSQSLCNWRMLRDERGRSSGGDAGHCSSLPESRKC